MTRDLCGAPADPVDPYARRLEGIRRASAEADSLDRQAAHLRAQAEQIRRDIADKRVWIDAWADASRWIELPDRLPGLRCGGDCCLHRDNLDCPRHPECNWRDRCPEIGTVVGVDRYGCSIFGRVSAIVDGFDPYVVWKATYGVPTGGPVCEEVRP